MKQRDSDWLIVTQEALWLNWDLNLIFKKTHFQLKQWKDKFHYFWYSEGLHK